MDKQTNKRTGVTMMLSLCRSPMPKTYVATQYPAHDAVNVFRASLKSAYKNNVRTT